MRWCNQVLAQRGVERTQASIADDDASNNNENWWSSSFFDSTLWWKGEVVIESRDYLRRGDKIVEEINCVR